MMVQLAVLYLFPQKSGHFELLELKRSDNRLFRRNQQLQVSFNELIELIRFKALDYYFSNFLK